MCITLYESTSISLTPVNRHLIASNFKLFYKAAFTILMHVVFLLFLCLSFHGHVSSLPSGIYLGVELLVHNVSICLSLVDAAKQFLKVVFPVYIPTSNSDYLHHHQH